MAKTNYTKQIISDYCVLDTETTGLSANYDSVIEIGLLKVRNNKIVERYSQLIHPNKVKRGYSAENSNTTNDKFIGHIIGSFITELTGITDDMVKDAPYIKDVENLVHDFIENDVILGHNTSFDIRFLNASFSKIIENKYMDTMPFSRKIYPHFPTHKLSYLTEKLGLSNNEHRALADCVATKELYDNLKLYLTKNNLKIDNL